VVALDTTRTRDLPIATDFAMATRKTGPDTPTPALVLEDLAHKIGIIGIGILSHDSMRDLSGPYAGWEI
jgi:hypothetical protein